MAKIWVGNLAPGIPERDVEDVFARFGRLRKVWVARNPPGFGFIEYESARDADDAVRALYSNKHGWRVDHAKSDGPKGRPGGDRGSDRGRDDRRRSPSPTRRRRSPSYDGRRRRSPSNERRRERSPTRNKDREWGGDRDRDRPRRRSRSRSVERRRRTPPPRRSPSARDGTPEDPQRVASPAPADSPSPVLVVD